MSLVPIKLSPAFKDYLWGGIKLKTEFNKQTSLNKVAESWELSMHKDGESIVADGKDKGLTLSEYINKYGKNLLGNNALKFDFFPILIKFIDAADNLSVQVHPCDEYALKNEGEYGKTEMWYVLDCEKDAYLYYGVNKELTKEEFAQRIKNNTLLEVLNKVKVKKGDVFFIDAGTVHAIGKGIVICEIQQNSNTTYRVYDYDRRDKNGNPRDLHIDKAIDVSTLTPSKPYKSENNILAKCNYFTVEKLECITSQQILITEACFKSIIVVSGSGNLILNDNIINFEKGDSIFIPAQNGAAKIEGNCELIISYV